MFKFITEKNVQLNNIPNFGNSKYSINPRFLSYDNKPILPVMGEFHYSRFNHELWERELIKMKECNINIIASYVFWNHHEEIKGEYNFEGNNNIRKFIELCKKHGLLFFLRIGPWVHAESRYGGFPDWVVDECGINTRCDDPIYLEYVDKYIKQIAMQITNLDNIVGIQIENELVNNYSHLVTLKHIVKKHGLDAPFFSATAWGGDGTDFPKDDMMPMFGGYPENPWQQDTLVLPTIPHWFFNHTRNDGDIGSDLMSKSDNLNDNNSNNVYQFPFMTCELGAGNQITYHRRPIISTQDVLTMAKIKIACGVNLLGYYMFHGGTNPLGKLSVLNESRDTGYPNDCPIISYDFQSPLGDYGQIRQSYYEYMEFHRFINDFSAILAPMKSYLPDVMPQGTNDLDTFRCAIRADEEQGFLFVSNYTRLQENPEHKDIDILITMPNNEYKIHLDIVLKNQCFYIPFGININGRKLLYATAELVGKEADKFIFNKIDGIEPKFFWEDKKHNKKQFDDIIVKDKCKVKSTIGEKIEFSSKKESTYDSYFDYLNLTAPIYEYSITVPDDCLYLQFKYKGNVAHVYCEDIIVADNYYNGQAFILDTRNLQGKELTIKIVELEKIDDIYFECRKYYTAELTGVTAYKSDILIID